MGFGKVRQFGSVVIMETAEGMASLISTRPDMLHESQEDWDQAVKWLYANGYEPPDDDPDIVDEDGQELYVVRASARVAV